MHFDFRKTSKSLLYWPNIEENYKYVDNWWVGLRCLTSLSTIFHVDNWTLTIRFNKLPKIDITVTDL